MAPPATRRVSRPRSIIPRTVRRSCESKRSWWEPPTPRRSPPPGGIAGVAVVRWPRLFSFLLRGHRVGDEIHREFGVVVTLKALVLPLVVPLAAVVLVAVED